MQGLPRCISDPKYCEVLKAKKDAEERAANKKAECERVRVENRQKKEEEKKKKGNIREWNMSRQRFWQW